MAAHTWTRIAIAAGVILLAGVVAKLIDSRISRRNLDPATAPTADPARRLRRRSSRVRR